MKSTALVRLIDCPPPFRGTATWHRFYAEALAELVEGPA